MADRSAPTLPRRNTSRRSACRRSGVTTATCTAVSLPAADARTRQPDVGAGRRAGALGLREVAGLVPVGRRRFAASGPRTGERPPALQQRDQRAVRPALDRRQRPAAGVQRLGQRACPGRVAGRPDELVQRDRARRPRPRRRARRPSRRAVGVGGDPDVDRLLARVGRDDRVGGPEQRLAQPLRDLRLADAGEAQRPDHALDAHAPRGEPRLDLVRPHRPHLARRPGQRDDRPGRRAGRPTSRARCRSGSASIEPDGSTHACLRLVSGNGWRRRAHRPAQPLERRLIHRPAARRRPPRPPRGSGRPASDRGRPS